MEKRKKTYLIRSSIFQLGLIISWILRQKNIISTGVYGILTLIFVMGVFYTLYLYMPEWKNILLGLSLIIFMIMLWLIILPSFY